ncbi:MAG: hypothetical protein J6W75_13045 [Bacteroidaceae bacterium]|nr:hypothetical protein [Bacteroidaceae bacterium]
MKQPVRIPIQLTPLTLDAQLAALGCSVSPRPSTLNRIRAYARAVRPL